MMNRLAWILLIVNIAAIIAVFSISGCNKYLTKQANQNNEAIAEICMQRIIQIEKNVKSQQGIVDTKEAAVGDLKRKVDSWASTVHSLGDILQMQNITNEQRKLLLDSIEKVMLQLDRSMAEQHNKWAIARDKVDIIIANNEDCQNAKDKLNADIRELEQKIMAIEANHVVKVEIHQIDPLTSAKLPAYSNRTVRYFNIKYVVTGFVPSARSGKTVYLSAYYDVGKKDNLVNVTLKVNGVRQPSDNSGYAFSLAHSGLDSIEVAIDGDKKSGKYRFAIVTSANDDPKSWSDEKKREMSKLFLP